jgi:hypothetical protein
VVEFWIDGSHIRRVRFESENRIETVELWDYGVGTDGLDWSRLPTFRSPELAARAAGEWPPWWKRVLHGKPRHLGYPRTTPPWSDVGGSDAGSQRQGE